MRDIENYILSSNLDQLNVLKDLIDKRMEQIYDDNFQIHEKIDEYLYYVVYDDLSHHLYCKGADAYRHYTNDINAVRIERKTKDLFPSWELMMTKENL